MGTYRPPEEFIVHETEHWLINHRVDSVLPGYLMIAAKAETNDLSQLAPAALAELGFHLANVQRALRELFAPPHFYVGRYGHMSGFSIHFHVIPIHEWVARAFLADERYRVVRQFYTEDAFPQVSDMPFDGAEMTLFVWREFCESRTPPPIEGLSVAETVAALRANLAVGG